MSHDANPVHSSNEAPAEEVGFYHRITTDFSDADIKPGRALDVGTTNIVAAAQRTDGSYVYNTQRNAFIEVRSDAFTRRMLAKLGIEHNVVDGRGCVIGDPAFELANIFEKDIRQPMLRGIIAPGDSMAVKMLKLVIEKTLGKPKFEGELCTLSVPHDPIDVDANVIYHRGAVQNILRELGYASEPIGQGEAVSFAELAADDFTGIGISCGGGTFNVCVSYKSIPALRFSIARGGDWIDNNVAKALGVPASRVCATKEHGIDLTSPKDRIEEAIGIYYQSLIRYTLETIRYKFSRLDDIPTFTRPVSLVCCGGTSLISGFVEMFQVEIDEIDFPVELREIRLAQDPTHTVATGLLSAAHLVRQHH